VDLTGFRVACFLAILQLTGFRVALLQLTGFRVALFSQNSKS